MYEGRLRGAEGSQSLLGSESRGLTVELSALRREYEQFIADSKGLEREIDLLKHNERLIEIAKHRENLDAIDSSGWLASLEQIKRAIEKRKTEQHEILRGYRLAGPTEEYETRARLERL